MPKKYAPVVELADTLDLGSSARAWGFKSLLAHQLFKLLIIEIIFKGRALGNLEGAIAFF